MDSRDRGDAVERALLDHGLRARLEPVLFGGLEDQSDVAGYFGFHVLEDHRGAEQHGRMRVVPARVHDAVVFRLVRDVVLFLQGQRVHVGAQCDACRALPGLQVGDDAAFGPAESLFDDRVPELFEYCDDLLRRLDLFPGQLRIHVEMPPEIDDLLFVRLRPFPDA